MFFAVSPNTTVCITPPNFSWALCRLCHVSFLSFFIGESGIWTQGFMVLKQAFYCLSHTSSPFCSGYVGDGSHELLCGLASNYDSLDLSFPSSWDYSFQALGPVIFLITKRKCSSHLKNKMSSYSCDLLFYFKTMSFHFLDR
jgi:hypothetical protein